MPLDRQAGLILGVLLLALPVQFFFSRFVSTPQAQRPYALRVLLSNAVGFKNKYLTWKSWHKWCMNLFVSSDTKHEYSGQDEIGGESPAVEVMNFKDPKGHFAGSPEPRSPRPSTVKFRVGQVVRHKLWGYRAVIVGWDEMARAPEAWIKQNHGPNKKIWKNIPNYSLLVDTRDRMDPQMTYVPQENLEVITQVKIIHPSVDDYFEVYDGSQYLPRPWLRVLYPHD